MARDDSISKDREFYFRQATSGHGSATAMLPIDRKDRRLATTINGNKRGQSMVTRRFIPALAVLAMSSASAQH
jgi:hypothetical protein